jgi:hypothetical protein
VTDIKNKSPFFMTVRTISWHHEQIICVTINYFSTSDTSYTGGSENNMVTLSKSQTEDTQAKN